MSKSEYKDKKTGNFATYYPGLEQWHIGKDVGGTIHGRQYYGECVFREHFKIDGMVTAKKIVEVMNARDKDYDERVLQDQIVNENFESKKERAYYISEDSDDYPALLDRRKRPITDAGDWFDKVYGYAFMQPDNLDDEEFNLIIFTRDGQMYYARSCHFDFR